MNTNEIRPRRLADYVGQEEVRKVLAVYLSAAAARGEALDHVLLTGYPGLGKTTLAHIIAAELGSKIHVTSGAALERAGDLAAILTNLSERDVLFIDEIHRLPAAVEEILYPAMEDFRLDLVVGKGPGARLLKLHLPRFTLVGATTRSGLLSAPLRDRFGISFKLDFYREEELQEILLRTARVLKIGLEPQGALEIAKRARGTPRVANRLLRRVWDFALVEGKEVIDATLARKALEVMELDIMGLGPFDRLLIKTIMEKFDGGPVGLDTLATALCEDPRTLEDVYEPFLIRCGLLRRTRRGRVLTPKAYEYFNQGRKKDGLLF